MFYHFVEIRRNGLAWLPHNHLVKKILEHFGLDLEEEESVENAIKLGSHCLRHMQYGHQNGCIVQRGTRARGGSQ